MSRPVFGGAKGEEGRFRQDVASAIAKVRAEITNAVGNVDLSALETAIDALEAEDIALDERLDALEAAPTRVHAKRSGSSQSLTAGSAVQLVYNTEVEDASSSYDNATGTFTAPADGIYIVLAAAAVAYSGTAKVGFLGIKVNDAYIAVQAMPVYGTDANYGVVSMGLNLSAGDTVKIFISIDSTAVGPVLAAADYCQLFISTFTGFATAAGGGGTIDGSGTAGQLAKWSDANTLTGVTDEPGFLYSNGAGTLSFETLKSAASQPLLDRAFILWYRSSSAAMGSLGALITQNPASATTPAKANTSALTKQQRLQYTGTTGTGQVIGCRTNEATFWPSVGFALRMIFGQESNIAGGRAFFGLTTLTTPINSDPSALTNIIGIGYDEADSDGGNWYLFYNDAAGAATKVDTGLARSATGLIKLEISTEDGVTYEVRVADLETGDYVFIDTAITGNVPDGETATRINAQIRNEVSGGGTAPVLSILYMCCEHGTHFP